MGDLAIILREAWEKVVPPASRPPQWTERWEAIEEWADEHP